MKMAEKEAATNSNDAAVPKLNAAQRAKIERNRQRALLLRESRAQNRPYKVPERKVIQPSGVKAVDTGGGFLLEDEEDIQQATKPPKITYKPGPVIGSDPLICDECDKPFMESYLYNTFDAHICDKCRDLEKHRLITRTEAKQRYLLKDADIDKREPVLKFLVKKNPRNTHFGDMKLYLEILIAARALEVWGSEEAMEEARQNREDNRQVAKQRKYDKKVKELRKAVRTSLWTKDLGPHEHEFGEETYDEEEDTYSRTCKTCGHVSTYEKM